MYSRETELRHLHPNDVFKLGEILDDNNCWKKLMEVIPKKINAQASSGDGKLDLENAIAAAGLKYNNDHIRLIESAFNRTGESRFFTQILFDEWGTSGRKHERPTVGVLLQLLIKAELYRAAEHVATEFLKEPPPPRPLSGPAARIDISLSDEIFNDIKDYVNDESSCFGTDTINGAANTAISGVMNHNKDYYTKYHNLDKHVVDMSANVNVPIPPPRIGRSARLQQQQHHSNQQLNQLTAQPVRNNLDSPTAVAVNNSSNEENQEQRNTGSSYLNGSEVLLPDNKPKFSELLTQPSYEENQRIPSIVTPLVLNTSEINNEISEAPIPMISLLAQHSTTSNNSESIEDQQALPVISALNLNTAPLALCEEPTSANMPNLSDVKSQSNSRSSSLSNDSIDIDIDLPDESNMDDEDNEMAHNYDDEDNSLPNLSFFEQRSSSNNDSSLTTVTGTSGENSFEHSMNDCSSTSTENIPCLSLGPTVKP